MPSSSSNSDWKIHLQYNHDDEDPERNKPKRSVADYCDLDRVLIAMQFKGTYRSLWTRNIESRLSPNKTFHEYERFIQHSLRKMLNSKELTKVLNANVHPRMFPQWIIMSPNATLLAYSGQPNIKHLRDQAALLSQVWKDNVDKLQPGPRIRTPNVSQATSPQLSSSISTTGSVAQGGLETLTIESAKSNIIVRAVQPRLLLVLVGGSPPQRIAHYFKISPEARGDPRYPSDPDDGEESLTGEDPPNELLTQSNDESIDEATPEYYEMTDGEKERLLNIQRRKIDAATKFMRDDFLNKGFVMPDETSIP